MDVELDSVLLRCPSGSGRNAVKNGRRASVVPASVLPEVFSNAVLEKVADASEIADDASINRWLQDHGVDTATWGQGDTKDISWLSKELKGNESALESWRLPNGEMKAVRTMHVLRAKVCSRQSLERGVFCFNTWQQFGDGRKRIRNGLLSEKLSTDEVPLEDHLSDVCKRAVAEEMQRVCEATFVVDAAYGSPIEWDESYRSPIVVETQHFIGATVEMWLPDLAPSFGSQSWFPELAPRFGSQIRLKDLAMQFGCPLGVPWPSLGWPIAVFRLFSGSNFGGKGQKIRELER
ncbi:unnamed protein product [Polarella glacialis]|uniref:Uncharacterized protein n=1 Tax=Polarella glacialis TaxID=89957 RepID=A0A813JXJ0_POLGL|nr:unnamed protein product [Polarella glacialis]